MRVKKVEYVDGYRLKILFSDRKTKIVDLSNLVKEGGFYFTPLRDIEFFKKVSLDDEKNPYSIMWPNDADICPDVLYKIGKNLEKSPKKTPIRKKEKISSVSIKSRGSIAAKARH
jgi:hypothetical protein